MGEENKDQVRIDSLQKLHTVYNLQEVLPLAPPSVGHTLRDSKLAHEVC